MQHYILIANDLECDTGLLRSEEIFHWLLTRKMWLLSERAPFLKHYRPGDKVILYLGEIKRRYFAAWAEIAGEVEEPGKEEQAAIASLGLFVNFAYKLPFKEIHAFEKQAPILPLVPDLEFIKDKKNYGLHLRLGAARIGEKDFERIVRVEEM